MSPTHIVLLTSLSLGACGPRITNVTPANAAPLDSVIRQVEEALNQYQMSRDTSLPRLVSAEFSFKAVTSATTGGTINFFIFKFGGSREKDVTHEVTFTYQVPSREELLTHAELLTRQKRGPKPFTDELAKTIQSAAEAVEKSKTAVGLPFHKLTVNFEYGVKWEGSVEANPTLSLVTVDVSGAKSKNTVQSMQLEFAVAR